MENINYIIPKNAKKEDIDLVTKQYLDFVLKQIVDTFTPTEMRMRNLGYGFDFAYDKISLDEISATTNEGNPVQLEFDVEKENTNFNKELELENKVSKLDLDKKTNEIKNEVNKYIASRFNDILNNKDVLDKLKLITSILNSCEDVDSLLEQLLFGLNKLLEQHMNNGLHIVDKDRIALEKLLKFNNFADWNVDDKNDPRYILNKPESLKANGGNADTLKNHKYEDIVNHQLENLIIGRKDSKDIVNVVINDEESLDKLFDSFFEEIELDKKNKNKVLKEYGKISFRQGYYYLSNPELTLNKTDSYELIFNGAGMYNTELSMTVLNIGNNIVFKDLCISDSIINISDKCSRFENVFFNCCDINIGDCEEILINKCKFINCHICYTGRMYNSLITENSLKNSGLIDYLGGNNIVCNNIYIY